jgi:hypothetical protein
VRVRACVCKLEQNRQLQIGQPVQETPAVSNYHYMMTTLVDFLITREPYIQSRLKDDMTRYNLLDPARYKWLCCVISDTRHQYWGRCIHKFLKCFNEVTCNSKASYRVSWMSDSSLKIYFGKEERRNLFAVLFPCNLRQRRFWAFWGSHGGVVEEAVHLAYDSVSLCLSSRASRPLKITAQRSFET